MSWRESSLAVVSVTLAFASSAVLVGAPDREVEDDPPASVQEVVDSGESDEAAKSSLEPEPKLDPKAEDVPEPIDTALSQTNNLTGIVTDSVTNKPVSGVCVDAAVKVDFGWPYYVPWWDDDTVRVIETTVSDEAGNFGFSLEPGTYVIRTHSDCETASDSLYVPVYSNVKHWVWQAKQFKVREDQRAHAKVVAVTGSKLTGQVLGDDGAPVEGLCVVALEPTENLETPTKFGFSSRSRVRSMTKLDSDGRYEMITPRGLHDIALGCFTGQGKPAKFGYLQKVIPGVDVADESLVVDADVVRAGSVTGSVVDQVGEAADYVCVRFEAEKGIRTPKRSDFLDYRSPPLSPGTYSIYVERECLVAYPLPAATVGPASVVGYYDDYEWGYKEGYVGGETFEEAAKIEVRAGGETKFDFDVVRLGVDGGVDALRAVPVEPEVGDVSTGVHVQVEFDLVNMGTRPIEMGYRLSAKLDGQALNEVGTSFTSIDAEDEISIEPGEVIHRVVDWIPPAVGSYQLFLGACVPEWDMFENNFQTTKVSFAVTGTGGVMLGERGPYCDR